MKFKPGDRVVADINGKWISATFLREYSSDLDTWAVCLWDDNHAEAPMPVNDLISEKVYKSKLFNALHEMK